MEACHTVEREVNNVLERLENFQQKNLTDQLGQAIQIVQKARADMAQQQDASMDDGAAPARSLFHTLQSVRDSLSKVSAEHRDLHSSVSKVGKAVDRTFVNDYDSTTREDLFTPAEQQRRLHRVILQHFYRQGQLEVGDALAREAGLTDLHLDKEPFLELNTIVEELHQRQLGPALEWARRHRAALNERLGHCILVAAPAASAPTQADLGGGSDADMSDGSEETKPLSQQPQPPPRQQGDDERPSMLEIKLHKLQFIELLKSGDQLAAVYYARQHFPPFASSPGCEVQALMGALMYSVDGEADRTDVGASGAPPPPAKRRLRDSPYCHLLDDSLWHEITDEFVRDSCALMGLSIESPLSVALNAGCTAIPALLNIKQVMQQRQVSGVWNAKDELPIEIDLGPQNRYHSIFACPILRQQTTEENPPARLNCGHCISKDAMSRLSNGHKLKCPYCPVESSANETTRIIF